MTSRRRTGVWAFVATGLVVAVALAFLVGPRASSEPDGLEKVAIEQGFDGRARRSATADGPTAGYSVDGVDDQRLGTGLAGLLGVGVTFVVGAGLVLAARRMAQRRAATPSS